MPLKNIPGSINPELLYILAKMGHGDKLIISDANFPSDSIASNCVIKTPIRVNAKTSEILKDILVLFPLDQYTPKPVAVMDRVYEDKKRNLEVNAYQLIANAAGITPTDLDYVERFEFYEQAKTAYAIIQTDDKTLYANILIYKGVI